MNRIISFMTVITVCAAMIFSGCTAAVGEENTSSAVVLETVDIMPVPVITESDTEETLSSDEEDCLFSEAEVDLIALVTIAEAEDECELGKRLVIDTILNRVDSDEFPDTVIGVIFQPYQFPSMINGRADSCEVTDDIRQLVCGELADRTNSDCVFFQGGGYSEYGTPMFRVQNHYFSSYE